MKKSILSLLALLMATTGSAQTILSEDFETGNTGSALTPVAVGEGWETVNSYTGSNTNYTWHNYYSDPEGSGGPTIGGACVAACDGPISVNPVDGSGPREEILLSPELTLDDTYQLQFAWRVSPMNCNDDSRYDLQVRVVTDGNLQAAETVFSIQNEQMLRESGVTVFPINSWDVHISKVDLSDWQGEKVRLAFVYKMYTTSANVVWLDDISVSHFTPAAGPVASLSMDRYDFGQVYIGEKVYSEVFTLTNTGKDGLRITAVDLPDGMGLNIDPATVSLRAYDQVDFQLSYSAAMTTKGSGEVVLHTTGGDVAISYSAQKELVPEGCLLETFNDYFPPAGWKNKGFTWSTRAIEGDHSAYGGGDTSDTWLLSPMLDLSDGGTLRFTFFDEYNDYSDSGYAPDQDPQVQVSHDAGLTWETVWTRDYNSELNRLVNVEIELQPGGEGESYVRWLYPAVGYDEDEGAYEHSSFTLDRVLLPNVVGGDGVPGKATIVAPANNATGVYPVDVVLQWGPAQFATGYKLYVGTNTAANDLIDGIDVGRALSYIIPGRLAYETQYRWKVVGYNDVGDAAGVVAWRFTTQPDASVVEFPWTENFDELTTKEPPLGWLSTTTADIQNRRWEPLNTNKAYGGTGSSMYVMWLNPGIYSTLTSPEFTLPAEGKSMSISFVWGDNHPVDLIVDETGLLKKQNVEGGNGYSDVVFEIFADGAWKQAAYLSENYNEDGDTKYWRNETIDLDEYAGKTVQFRWINHSYSSRHRGAGLDNIVIDGTIDDGVAFNRESWDVGKVNYGKANNSGDLLTIRNSGKNPLTLKSATFKTENFETSLAAGTELEVGEGMTFDITFLAKDTATVVNDELTLEFESGYIATFPVSGEALPKDMLFYGFEVNPMDYVWDEDFTTIDVDGQVNYMSKYYLTTIENDGGRYAFTLAEHNNPNLTAHTGKYTLVASAPDNNSSANDWLISKRIRANENTTFDFYARNLSTTNSVFSGDNDLHHVEVLVSNSDNTSTASFSTVMRDTEMPYLGENEWNHYTVDLSAFAGEDIYVAVRHTTVSANWLAFFDDFTFSHIGEDYPFGDVNLDGQVGIGDIVTITNIMAGIDKDEATKARADLNGDGSVGIGDIVVITNIMAGINTEN